MSLKGVRVIVTGFSEDIKEAKGKVGIITEEKVIDNSNMFLFEEDTKPISFWLYRDEFEIFDNKVIFFRPNKEN